MEKSDGATSTNESGTYICWLVYKQYGNTPFNFDTVITGDTTIYAKWNPVTHTVSFDVDGGSIVPAQTIAHGEKQRSHLHQRKQDIHLSAGTQAVVGIQHLILILQLQETQ